MADATKQTNPSTSTQEVLTLINESYNQYIVQPSVDFGLAGFVFDIEGETSMTLQSEITDHYIEDNSAIQDHISLKPLRVVLKKYVGELVYSAPSIANTAQKVIKKLSILNSYLPTLATAASEFKEFVSFKSDGFTGGVNNASDIWSLVKNLNPFASKQQQAYQFFKALYEKKILVSLQTPFEFIQSMAIETITVTQPEDSVSISDFSLTLKKIRVASTQTVKFDKTNTQNRNASQAAPIINKGKAVGTKVVAVL